jgi:adenine-specific DNA-methyltransferase
MPASFTLHGGLPASPGKKRSTPPSPPKPTLSIFTTSPTKTKSRVRVAGPFTVDSLSPHRVLGMDEDDELIDPLKEGGVPYGEEQDFAQMILETLKVAGVQQAHKEDNIDFISLVPWPGDLVCAEGRYVEGGDGSGAEKRAAIFIGPEFGTVTRPDLAADGA